ncbi:MAG: hypothetical protein JRJ20_02560, partial [Deltaproteobacteria bacterium]|nr:hypothetical protein [Deltaproteobacteria bacterium]
NQFGTYDGFLSESDSGPFTASASIWLQTKGEEGYASATYNGAIRVRSDSSTTDGTPGDSIVSRASQRTIFDITSDTLSDGTFVQGSVNISLHGIIINVGNKDYGTGAIDLSVNFRDPDESRNLFTGSLSMTKNGLDYVGFSNFGSVQPGTGTGNPFLSFDFDTSETFEGYVGDSFSVEYTLQANTGACYRSSFSDTGSFSISFEGNDAIARVVPPAVVPIPATFASAYGSTSSDSNYNISCDFDEDGDVDGGDLAEFAAVV